jgi:type IV secretion system protein VirB10
MKRNLLAAVIAFAIMNSLPSGYAQSTPESAASMLTVPADTTIPLRLGNAINSRTARPGQAIYLDTIFPITVGNKIVIPRGSSVKGSITQVARPKRLKGKAQIGIRFETLILPNGTTRSLRGTLSAFGGTGEEGFKPDESKIEGASSRGNKADTVARTTVTGAEVGTIAGAASGAAAKGLGIGSLAGAAGGLVWVFSKRGKEIVLPPGTNMELQLSEPLSFSRDELDPPSRYDSGPQMPRRD